MLETATIMYDKSNNSNGMNSNNRTLNIYAPCCRYCCCMAAAVEAFHDKCQRRGLPLFAFAPPHLAALCCRDTRNQQEVRQLSLLLEEETCSLLPTQAVAASVAAESPGASTGTVYAAAAGDAAATQICGYSRIPKPPDVGMNSESRGVKGAAATWSGLLLGRSSYVPRGPATGQWPVSHPCCFVLRCIRISRAQAEPCSISSEALALQEGRLLQPQLFLHAEEGGGIPTSEALDIRADFANKVVGGGILYQGNLEVLLLLPVLLLRHSVANI